MQTNYGTDMPPLPKKMEWYNDTDSIDNLAYIQPRFARSFLRGWAAHIHGGSVLRIFVHEGGGFDRLCDIQMSDSDLTIGQANDTYKTMSVTFFGADGDIGTA